MDFTSYWKEISVVLAGLFAILGAVSDVKDKRTGKITIWGRVFFTLTFLSVIGGVYAQWRESAADDQRNKETQANLLDLLERTERSVNDLSRLLQPIDKPRVTVFLKPNCVGPKLKPFCDAAKAQGVSQAAQRHATGIVVFTLSNVDWSSWSKSPVLGSIQIMFFKESASADGFVATGRSDAVDMRLNLLVTPVQLNSQRPTASVSFETDNEEITVLASEDALTPDLQSDKILSVVDLPGSTMILSEPNKLFDDATVTAVYINTAHGQTIAVHDLQAVDSDHGRIFVNHFPSKN